MQCAQETANLIQLYIGGSEQFLTGCEIIHDGNGENLQAHQLLEVFFRLIISERFLESHHRVFILIGQLPPVGAHLTDIRCV
jgi:hypothetical protein